MREPGPELLLAGRLGQPRSCFRLSSMQSVAHGSASRRSASIGCPQRVADAERPLVDARQRGVDLRPGRASSCPRACSPSRGRRWPLRRRRDGCPGRSSPPSRRRSSPGSRHGCCRSRPTTRWRSSSRRCRNCSVSIVVLMSRGPVSARPLPGRGRVARRPCPAPRARKRARLSLAVEAEPLAPGGRRRPRSHDHVRARR